MILLKFTLKKVYGIGNRCKVLITILRGGKRDQRRLIHLMGEVRN